MYASAVPVSCRVITIGWYHNPTSYLKWFLFLKEWLGWETLRSQELMYFLISGLFKRFRSSPSPYVGFGFSVGLHILIPNVRLLEVHKIYVNWTESEIDSFPLQSLFVSASFSVALLPFPGSLWVFPYQGVKVSSSYRHDDSHLYSHLCFLL